MDLRVQAGRDSAGIERGAPFTFLFDGQPIHAYAGETVGAALTAAGITSFRTTRRGGRPRGLFCGIGVCFDCLVVVDGRPNERACLTSVRAGAVISTQAPSAVAGVRDLPSAVATGTIDADLAVIGAGPAGLAAAAEAAEAGCRVVLIDAYPRPGGQYYKQLPAEFGARAPGALHHDFAVAERLFDRLDRSPNVRLLAEATVWTAQPPQADGAAFSLYLSGPVGAGVAHARRVVLAPGAIERVLPFPGWDLPGVITAGAAQTLVKSQRVLPGQRVLLSGSGPFLLPVAAGLAEAGATVVAVCEATAPWRWGRYAPNAWGHWEKLAEGRSYAQRLGVSRVPFKFGRAVVRTEGDGRVQRVTVARLAADWTPIKGSEEHIDVDTLAVGYGFVPATELSHLLGCAHRYDVVQRALVARHDAEMRGTRAGVYVAGEITGIGGSSVALAEGALAGLAAARDLGFMSEREAQARMAPCKRRLCAQLRFAIMVNHMFRPRPGWLHWLTPETVVCRCEEVSYDELRRAAMEYQAHDAKTIKLTTRCGMGYCQGRVCGHVVTELAAALSRRHPADVGTFATRPIVRPVLLEEMI